MSWLATQAPASTRLGAGGPLPGLRGPAGFEAAYDADALPGTLPAGEAARLSMYASPPPGALSIEEFESTALDRLRGELRCLEEGVRREEREHGGSVFFFNRPRRLKTRWGGLAPRAGRGAAILPSLRRQCQPADAPVGFARAVDAPVRPL